ncbi:MAG: hypothetical protein RLZZ462_1361 [Bacteroidota bacterium]|jgi:hypothetical protein
MENEIKTNINNPKQLEKMYREHKGIFITSFNAVFQELRDEPAAQAWNERLNYKDESVFWGSKNEILFILVAAFIGGLIAKIPSFLGLEYDVYMSKNIGFVVFPILTMYFIWKQQLAVHKFILPFILYIGSAIFVNSLPYNENSSTFILTLMHLPIFLWAILGYTFIGGDLKNNHKTIAFLKYNGNFVIMTGLIFISGMFFTGITIALFELLKIDIKDFYFEQIAVWGLAAMPILSTFLIQNNPELVNKISPTIARIFTPIIFVTLLVFLSTLIYTGVNIYNDRNFLLLFNILLIAVMSIILFSLTEVTNNASSKINLIILLGLALLTIIANAIALSAISFRLSEFGLSPNRLAVLGANLLIFAHLLLVSYGLIKNLNGKATLQNVEATIASFIPVYAIWAAFISFVLPFIFQFI